MPMQHLHQASVEPVRGLGVRQKIFEARYVFRRDSAIAGQIQEPGGKFLLIDGRLDGRLRGTTDRFYLITRIRDFSYVDFGRLREKADLLGSDVERNRSEERRVGQECVSKCRY